jgi:hypothetical protein
MKNVVFLILLLSGSLSLLAWENQDWLTEYYWSIEMSDGVYIDWPGHGPVPHGEFRKLSIPVGSTIYRSRLRNEYFNYLYQTEKNKIFFLEIAKDSNGKDLEFDIRLRENYSYISISRGYLLYIVGERNGRQYNADYPLVGIWGALPALHEIRLVESANYVFYLEIPKEMPGFAVRNGTYLFKQVGDNVFETDSCFPDGHMRLEIRNRDWLVLTPLFTLPDERGLVQPLYLRQWGRLNDSQ